MSRQATRTTSKNAVARRTAVVAVASAMVLMLTACLTTDQSNAMKVLNNDRKASGARSLPTHSQAQKKAQAWADKLARENRLVHSNLSQGISCWRGLAENVGYGTSITAVQRQFMRSSSHKANVLNRSWNGVGVGVARNGNRVFVVQVFVKGC